MVNRFTVAYCDKESFYSLFVIAVLKKIGKRLVGGWRRGPGQPLHRSCQQISDLLVWKKATLHLQICTRVRRCKRRDVGTCSRDGTFHFPGSALSYSYRGTADMNDGGARGSLPHGLLHLSQSSVVSVLAPSVHTRSTTTLTGAGDQSSKLPECTGSRVKNFHTSNNCKPGAALEERERPTLPQWRARKEEQWRKRGVWPASAAQKPVAGISPRFGSATLPIQRLVRLVLDHTSFSKLIHRTLPSSTYSSLTATSEIHKSWRWLWKTIIFF